MSTLAWSDGDGRTDEAAEPKPVRADARRSLDALLKAALEVFAALGVDAPVRDIAARAGVGVGTLYRHFPQRANLIAAVFRREVDACADAAAALAAEHGPAEALARWMQRYAAFIATKRGLAAALHSGDPAFDALPDYFQRRLLPAFRMLLGAAAKTGDIRGDVDPNDLLSAIGRLGMGAGDDSADQTRRMVSLLVDGLRYGAGHPGNPAAARRGAGG